MAIIDYTRLFRKAETNGGTARAVACPGMASQISTEPAGVPCGETTSMRSFSPIQTYTQQPQASPMQALPSPAPSSLSEGKPLPLRKPKPYTGKPASSLATNKMPSSEFRKALGENNLAALAEPSIRDKECFFEAIIEHYALLAYRNEWEPLLSRLRASGLMASTLRHCLDNNGGFQWVFVNEQGVGFIPFLMRLHDSSRPDVARDLGTLLGIRLEYCFGIFPQTPASAGIAGTPFAPIEGRVPAQAQEGTSVWKLTQQKAILGYAGQKVGAILEYRNEGVVMYIPATVTKNSLQIGHDAAPAYLLNREKISENSDTTVLFCQDIAAAFVLDSLLADSKRISHADAVVTGHADGLAALPCLLVGDLFDRDVILIAAPDRNYMAHLTGYIGQCESAQARSIRIYPWPLLPFGSRRIATDPNGFSDPWERELVLLSRFLSEEESPSALVEHIKREALTINAFREWGREVGLFDPIRNSDATSDAIAENFPLRAALQPGGENATRNSWQKILTPGDISVLYGPQNGGKSLVSMEIARGLASGGQAFFLPSEFPMKLALIDAETPPIIFNERLQQLQCWDMENLETLPLRVQHKSWAGFLLSEEQWREKLLASLTQMRTSVLILDNLTALCGPGDIYNAKTLSPIWDFVDKCGRKGIAVLLIHHTASNGENVRGSREIELRAQNIIELIPLEKDRWGLSGGAAIELRLRKSKALHYLEDQIFRYYLPAGAGQWRELPSDERTPDLDHASDGDTSFPPPEGLAQDFPLDDAVAKQTGSARKDGLEATDTYKLSEQEQLVYDLLFDKGAKMTRQEIQDNLGLKMSNTNKILGALQKKHQLVDKIGCGSKVHYTARKKPRT